MNMRCDTVRDLIPLCRDGIASAASRVIVEEHLKSCPACRNYYKAYIKSMKKNAQHAGITVTMKNPDGFAALSKRIRRRRRLRSNVCPAFREILSYRRRCTACRQASPLRA